MEVGIKMCERLGIRYVVHVGVVAMRNADNAL